MEEKFNNLLRKAEELVQATTIVELSINEKSGELADVIQRMDDINKQLDKEFPPPQP